ncbi:MAG: hypothetical protein ACKVZJ_01270 [Phycisphaerales bacterium]
MNELNRARPRHALALAALVLLSGCGGGGSKSDDAPLSAVNDKAAHTDRRIRAIERTQEAVAAGEIGAPAARENLKRVAWSRSTFWKVRASAIDELLKDEANAADTRNMLRLMLPTEPASEIVGKITDLAASGKWTEMSGALVRRWSKPESRVSEMERPERAALTKIFPDRAVEDTVFAVFAGRVEGLPEGSLDERTRQDAWALLRRIDTTGRTRELLASGDASNDELMGVLQRGARDLRVVPETSEELAWLRRLGAPDRSAFWQECAAAAARLSDEQTRGLAMRHLGVLRWAAANRSEWLTMDRAALIAEIERRLEGRPRHWRIGEGSGGGAGGRGESLHRFRDELAWGDGLAILVGDDVTRAEGVAAALFEHAERDRKDNSTEYGGNIDADGERVRVDLFPPRASQRYGDRQFVPSEEMLKAGDTALFHFHFHSTTWKNADYAGPSDGDHDSADALGRACLLFTAIDDNTLGVDYYQRGGATIDLGALKKKR